MCVCVELYIIRFCHFILVDVFTNCRCLGKRNSLHDSHLALSGQGRKRQCTKEIKREPVREENLFKIFARMRVHGTISKQMLRAALLLTSYSMTYVCVSCHILSHNISYAQLSINSTLMVCIAHLFRSHHCLGVLATPLEAP